MRNLFLIVVIAAVAVLAGCSDNPPKVNQKTVLTVDQYNQLMAAMSQKRVEDGKNGGGEVGTAFAQGGRLMQDGRYAEAATQFEAAIKADPNDSRSWYLLGTCREKTGDLASAQAAYKKSYDLMATQGYIPQENLLK